MCACVYTCMCVYVCVCVCSLGVGGRRHSRPPSDTPTPTLVIYFRTVGVARRLVGGQEGGRCGGGSYIDFSGDRHSPPENLRRLL